MTKSNKEADTRAHHWPCARGLAASADDRVIRDQSRPMGLTGSGRLLTYLSVKLTRSEKIVTIHEQRDDCREGREDIWKIWQANDDKGILLARFKTEICFRVLSSHDHWTLNNRTKVHQNASVLEKENKFLRSFKRSLQCAAVELGSQKFRFDTNLSSVYFLSIFFALLVVSVFLYIHSN